MTKLYLLFGLLLSGPFVLAQNVVPGEINSSGGTMSLGGIVLTYAIGNTLDQAPADDSIHLPREIFAAPASLTEEEVLTTGTEDLTGHGQVLPYPNPVQDILHFRSDEQRQGRVQVYNTHGQRVLDRGLLSTQESLDLSQLPSGLYQLKLEAYDTQEILSYKLIKR